MSNSAPRVPATATFNRVSGAMWLTFADGRTVTVASDVRDHRGASVALNFLGAVRFSDWGLVASKSPMRQAHIEVADTW